MKKLLFMLVFVVTVIAVQPNTANASVNRSSDFSDVPHYEQIDTLYKTNFGNDYRQLYPFGIVLNYELYSEGYHNDFTVAVFSKYPLVYVAETGLFLPNNYVYTDNKYSFNKNDTIWAHFGIQDTGAEYSACAHGSIYMTATDYTYYANYRINDTNDNLVFQGAPLGILTVVTEQSIHRQTPMSVVVFLVPFVISLVVSLASLRLCLRKLQTILQKA